MALCRLWQIHLFLYSCSLLHAGAGDLEGSVALRLRNHPRYHLANPDIPLYVIVITLPNIIVTLLYNFVMYFVYTRKIPFFEQWRTNKDAPWPWESNP